MTPGSINLSQGFPDFDPPQEILDALKEAAEQSTPVFHHLWGEEFPGRAGRNVYKEICPRDRSGKGDCCDLRGNGSDDGGDDDRVQSGR